MTQWTDSSEAVVDIILSRVGKDLRVGLPLGLGKATSVINALYARAVADPSISLRIFTALTLARPHAKSDLERRFIDPLFDRLAGNYPELAYNAPLEQGTLPSNITIHEFYFPAGRRLGVAAAQQSYTSANYTHVARDLLDNGINVIAQLIARCGKGSDARVSLSSNPDITIDVLPELRRREAAGQGVAVVGEINDNLPFMMGPAELPASEFDVILHDPAKQFDLFAVPRRPVSLTDYAAAFRITSLIEDGGTIQVGIGGFADALTQVLKLRHLQNDLYRDLASALGIVIDPAQPETCGPFEQGLYGCSEMLIEGMVELMEAGVLKRRAWDDQPPGVDNPVIHSAFFLGSADLYARLRAMDDVDRSSIAMCPVSYVNQLYGDESGKRASRQKARFINKAMLATGLGAIVSDGFDNGQVVSGVGGQYNFVAQAHELADARAILFVNAVRESGGWPRSNIVWSYGHTTIPRHLRDVVVTEYGVAELRGKCDRDVVIEMLGVTDARFQDDLLRDAVGSGKIEPGFRIPSDMRRNTPASIARSLCNARAAGALPDFPIGTNMLASEIRLIPALGRLKAARRHPVPLFGLLRRAITDPPLDLEEKASLERLGLDRPAGLAERLMAWLVNGALKATRSKTGA